MRCEKNSGCCKIVEERPHPPLVPLGPSAARMAAQSSLQDMPGATHSVEQSSAIQHEKIQNIIIFGEKLIIFIKYDKVRAMLHAKHRHYRN